MTSKTDKTDALRKIAILVSTLDPDAADELLERLPQEQAAAVRNLVMRLDDVSEVEQEQIAYEFLNGGATSMPPKDPGVELDESLASKLASPRGYSDHLETASPRSSAPFRFLGHAETDAIAKHLMHENPQVSAIVVAHLPPTQAADLIAHFDPARQADILRRVSELDLADTDVVRDIEQHLETLLSEDIRLAESRVAGLSAVAAILDAAGDQRSALASSLSRHQRDLASRMTEARFENRPAVVEHSPTEAIRGGLARKTRDAGPAKGHDSPSVRKTKTASHQETLTFDDLAALNDLALARIFRESEPQIALLALAGAEPKFAARLLRQLPRREARSLRRRMESLGPLQLKDLAHAQQQIARLAGRLMARGAIPYPGSKRFTVAA